MNNTDLKGADASILGQILSAQSIIFVLTSKKQIAEYFAKSLSSVPGVDGCRVCMRNSYSQEGVIDTNLCKECENFQMNENGDDSSKNFICKIKNNKEYFVFPLETVYYRFGFFVFNIKQNKLFDLYRPFICNLGNFVALSLENRLHKNDLEKANDVLELRVKERTAELQELNLCLKKEIQEHKQTELALRESEDQFRFLFNTMVQGVIIQDNESKIVDANDASCEILGLTKNQLLGKTAYDPRWKLIHEDGSILYPEEMPSNIALRTCKPVTDVLIGAFIPEKNSYNWILTSSTPKFRDGDTRPYLTMTTFSNITDRKKSEDVLYESQQMFRTLVENSPDIIARYDNECKRIYVNPVYLKEANIPHRELLSTTPIQRSPLPIESAKVLQNLLLKVLNSGEADSEDVLWPKKDNMNCWYNVYASPEFDREGKVVSVMTISRDITARKQVEEEISKLNQELEKRVFERTTQLEVANKELEAFTYSVSHDLRAPLRSIDGFSEILLDQYSDKVDDTGKNYLHRVRAATQRMSDLIEDLLNLSRISRTKMEIEEVNLSNIARDIVSILRESQPQRQVDFVVQDGITARGDNRLLRIALENLLGNAWKFTSKHKSAYIEFGVHDQNGLLVYFIRDNGAGFDMQYAQRLFGAFQRLHTENEFPGTGIGLATVQRIIHRHGGKLWAEGEIEKGAIFYFTIP